MTAAAAISLGACSVTEGPLLERIDARAADAGADAAHDASGRTPLAAAVRPNMSLQYQISAELDTRVDVQLFVSDLFDTSAQQVAALHAAGRLAMAYVSVGSLERWREDADQFPRAAVGATLAAYPDEAWLDIRQAEVRALMQARFDLARRKGFDGLFVSTLGGYNAPNGFELTRADELDYTLFLADAAHDRSLSIGLSGDFELSPQLVRAYDWAIAIGCIAADSCVQLAPLQAAGLAVFDLEIEGVDHDGACKRAAAYAIPITFKRPEYDAFRSTCP
jgi:hypothetical protein